MHLLAAAAMCAAALLALLVPVHADGPSLGAGVEASAATGGSMGARRLSDEPGVFITIAALKAAVNEWVKDATAAAEKHGNISGWDTSRVQDMQNLFIEEEYVNNEWVNNGLENFNGEVGGWELPHTSHQMLPHTMCELAACASGWQRKCTNPFLRSRQFRQMWMMPNPHRACRCCSGQ